MKLSSPIRFKIEFNSKVITNVSGPEGQTTFVAPVTNPRPKIYVVLDNNRPIYIGATNQPIRSRLRLGFEADGNNGYRGYLWRHSLTKAEIDIWLVTVEEEDIQSMTHDPSIKRALGNAERLRDIVIETVEAEAAMLIRQEYDRWPEYQSEIHFHQSGDIHRQAAQQIVSHYRSTSCPTG